MDQFASLKSTQWDRILSSCMAALTPPVLDTYMARLPEPPRPQRSSASFTRHMQPTDWLIPLLFLALLLVSLSHMVTFAGQMAHEIYHEAPLGFQGMWLSRDHFTLIHQIGFFVFSELGVLFFYTRHCITRRGPITTSLVSAILCACIAIYANVVSMMATEQLAIGITIGVLVPVLTMMLGERIAEIIRHGLHEKRLYQQKFEEETRIWSQKREEMRQMYEKDYQNYVDLVQNPVFLFKNAQTLQLIYQKIVEHYKSTAAGRQHEWDIVDEKNLASREITRYLSFFDTPIVTIEPVATQPEPSQLPTDSKAQRLAAALRENPELLDSAISGADVAKKLVERDYFDSLTGQYVNKIRKQLDKY